MQSFWVYASLISCWFCYSKAERLNRNQLLWAIIGFFLPLVSLIIVYLIPPLAKNRKFNGSSVLDDDLNTNNEGVRKE